jgi:1-phosphofructokinase
VIVTLTPNPSVDRTIAIDSLRRGEVQRATSSRLDPGGKGVNVSRALAAHGHPTVAVLPSGGADGARLADLLAPFGVATVTVPIAQDTRSNVTLVEPDGTTTKINEPGPALNQDEAATMQERVVTLAQRGVWTVLCGSLPRGVDGDFFRQLTERLHARGARVALDTSGPPLAAAMPANPELIKPNAEELAELVGRPLPTLGDVVQAAQDLLAGGAGSVLVSLGGDGALLVEPGGVYHARAPKVDVLSTVGAGDATLAGFLAGGASGPEALRLAVSFGTAAVTLAGSVMPTPDDIRPDLVDVTPDVDTTLSLDGVPA